jgi:hypothetical protein
VNVTRFIVLGRHVLAADRRRPHEPDVERRGQVGRAA